MWQASALRTTELIASLHKSIYTLETETARASQHRDDRLAAAERMVTRLEAVVSERDRSIDLLACQLAQAEAQHIVLRGVAAGYYRQLQKAMMAMCTGGDRALHAAQQTIASLKRTSSR